MKPFLPTVAVLAFASTLAAETVRFTDGTHMEVESFEIRDDVVILVTPDGKLRSVPRSFVDLEALPDEEATIAEAIELVGLRRLTDDLAASARRAAEGEHDEERPASAMMAAALTDGFDADRIYAVAESAFRDQAAGVRLEPVLEWLRSPTARRVGHGATRSLEGAMAELAASPPERGRVELMMRLDDATGTSEAAVELQAAMLRAMLQGLSMSRPSARQAIEDAVDEARPRLARRTRARIHVSLHVMYRDVSDDELQEYLVFLESENGRWLTRALMTTLLAAMDEGARRSGEILAQKLKNATKLVV